MGTTIALIFSTKDSNGTKVEKSRGGRRDKGRKEVGRVVRSTFSGIGLREWRRITGVRDRVGWLFTRGGRLAYSLAL